MLIRSLSILIFVSLLYFCYYCLLLVSNRINVNIQIYYNVVSRFSLDFVLFIFFGENGSLPGSPYPLSIGVAGKSDLENKRINIYIYAPVQYYNNLILIKTRYPKCLPSLRLFCNYSTGDSGAVCRPGMATENGPLVWKMSLLVTKLELAKSEQKSPKSLIAGTV